MSPILQAVNETPLHLLLRRRETLVVQGTGELCCEDGEVWLTESGSNRDCILSPGDRWPLQQGLEVALSVGSSRVDLQACKLEYSIVSPK